MNEKIDKEQDCLFLIARNGLCGLINIKGEVIIPCEWDWLSCEFAEGLLVVERDGKYGFIDYYGNVSLDCKWDDAEPFSEGIAKVKKNGKWGYIDRNTGYYAIPCNWNYATSFVNGMAFVSNDENKSGYIDKAGNSIGGFRWQRDYEDINLLISDSLARVKDEHSKYGYIDKFGEVVIPCNWKNISHFTDSLARIEADNEKYGFINRHGEIVSPCVFDFAYCFSEGFACVTEYNKRWKEDRWLYQGVPFKYCKFINTRGEFVTNSFDDARSFQEGLAAVKVCGRWGFINTHGEIVCQCKWDEVKDFQEGMAPVKKEGYKRRNAKTF